MYFVADVPTGNNIGLHEFEIHLLKFPNIFPAELLNVPGLVILVPSESVFVFVNKFPLIKLSVPLTEVLALKVTPAELLIVKFFTVAGNPFPVTCAALPL